MRRPRTPMDHYKEPARAAHYRAKYRASWLRRLSHRRERALLRRALAAGPHETVLDCPCGAGRMLGLATAGADLSLAMVREARAHAGCRQLATARADALPFPDGAFDAALCHRLLHHVHEPEARRAILRELARVARHAVVVSYWDARARPRRRPSRRSVLAPGELAADAGAAGLRVAGPVRFVAHRFSALAVARLTPAGSWRRTGPGRAWPGTAGGTPPPSTTRPRWRSP